MLEALVKQQQEVLTFLTAVDFASDPNTWSYNESRGGWSSAASHNYGLEAGYLPTHGFLPFKLSASQLRRIRQFSARFTSYYQTPTGGMGYSMFRITLNDGNKYHLGTMDAWTSDTRGQRLLNGEIDYTLIEPLPVDYINRYLVFKIPTGKWVTALDICSACYVEYPRGVFGMKDIRILLG